MSSAHVLFMLCLCWIGFCTAIEKITLTQFLKDSDFVVSNNGDYKLGFFSPPNSTHRYVGIWYNKVSKDAVFWVANRNNPVNDTSGVLRVSVDGNLVVLNGKKEILWSSNISIASATNASQISTQLLDSGNLVLLDEASKIPPNMNGTTLWQSFDHPTDALLPNAKITFDESNMKHALPCWKSLSDPSIGLFSLGTDSLIHSQAVVWNGDRRHWRSGPWNGNIFLGLQYSDEATNYANTFVRPNPADRTVDIAYTGARTLSFSHYALSYDGVLSEKWWDSSKGGWQYVWKAIATDCDIYGHCGAFGTCNALKAPACKCLKGFIPRNTEEWSAGNWSNGCVRREALQCGTKGSKEDGFLTLKMVKVPDLAEWSVGLNQVDCRKQCLKNCSCVAYAYDAGAGCMYWSKDLIDIQEFSSGGVDLYLRLPASELAPNKKKNVAIICATIIGALTLASLAFFVWRKCRSKDKKENMLQTMKFNASSTQIAFEELPLFELKKLIAATNDFHHNNKLGEGGFGPVFKGKLQDGQEIAVKRLSAASGQGIDEFMNEVVVISKLQHRNLVKLLGCCAEKQEKMLIYEYMPNKSLDVILFDSVKKLVLNWEKRFNIVEGISRGLVYLHRDSRLRIIHRDLKASNILLDEDLNPKISDFGMARIFSTKQDQDSTRRVVGTYGYMSPEYAMEGHFSEKSDVYSFGVLLLEILTGKKNNSFWLDEQSLTLLGYVWKLWNDDNVASIIDPFISDPKFLPEVLRCIHVGLLCVQEFPEDRPSTSTVLSMIVNDIAHLPSPKHSGFTRRLISSDSESSGVGGLHSSSTSDYNSITHLSAR